MDQPRVAYWRVILAAILDFLTAFVVGGYVIAVLSGQTTSNGFNLQGASALALLAVIIAYFILGNRFGGTVWRRILGVPRQDQ